MNVAIGRNLAQPEGFSAFIPEAFPPKGMLNLPLSVQQKYDQARGLVGKLDGATHQLPDVDFFVQMFVLKDATSSAQIEGTKATMVDAIEMEAGIAESETDANDILHYTKALHYGIKRLSDLPMSLRLVEELHHELMLGARATHFADPGHFRQTQNWIDGTKPSDAKYVPPPVEDMKRALGDLEKFLHDEAATLPLVQTALMHAQFETIHPFLDGNVRTGRLLVTLQLYRHGLLEKPVLFLSSFFKRHQKTYYNRLDGYHAGKVEAWLGFFSEGVLQTAAEAIEICHQIARIRDEDMGKIQVLAKRESESSMKVLHKLYSQPVISSAKAMEWTGFTRAGAQQVIDRLVKLEILVPRDESKTYGRVYEYRRYLDLFTA
jgi:Fic family protein